MKFVGGKRPNLKWQKLYIVCYNNNYSGNGENVCIKGTLYNEMQLAHFLHVYFQTRKLCYFYSLKNKDRSCSIMLEMFFFTMCSCVEITVLLCKCEGVNT